MSSSIKIRDTSMIDLSIKEENKLDGRYYLLDQKHDTLECLFCCFCEGSNEYAVAESDPNFAVLSKKGYIREESDCMARVLCVCNRPFMAKMKLFNEEVAVAERPCKYPMLYAAAAWSSCRAWRTTWRSRTRRGASWGTSAWAAGAWRGTSTGAPTPRSKSTPGNPSS